MKLPSDHAGLNHLVNNLFLALVPQGPAGLEVDNLAKQKKAEYRLTGKPLGLPQYHISLFSFGTFADIPSDLVSAIGETVAPLAATTEPFPVCFDQAMTFDTRQPKLPFVLRSSKVNQSLMEFYRKLSPRVQGSRRALKPHITLLYDAKNISEHSVHPVGWTVSELVLVRSYVGLGRHKHLARWPLLGKPSGSVQLDFPMSFD